MAIEDEEDLLEDPKLKRFKVPVVGKTGSLGGTNMPNKKNEKSKLTAIQKRMDKMKKKDKDKEYEETVNARKNGGYS